MDKIYNIVTLMVTNIYDKNSAGIRLCVSFCQPCVFGEFLKNGLCGFIRQAFVQILLHNHYNIEAAIKTALGVEIADGKFAYSVAATATTFTATATGNATGYSGTITLNQIGTSLGGTYTPMPTILGAEPLPVPPPPETTYLTPPNLFSLNICSWPENTMSTLYFSHNFMKRYDHGLLSGLYHD